MNSYAGLSSFKNRLGITGTTDDVYLRNLLDAISRMIDDYCHRTFYAETATRYYDGAGIRLFLYDDLLSITTLKTDEDGDGTYENNFTITPPADYFLYPLNTFPKTKIEINPNGDYGSFASGIQKGVQIVGLFGYGNGISAIPYQDSTTITAEAIDIGETAIDVVSGTALEVGQTILIESEQMYIIDIAENTITVIKGVNGTTDAAHTTGKTIYVYKYPEPIKEACIMQTGYFWKAKDSAYTQQISTPEFGGFKISEDLDPNIKRILKPYIKLDGMI